MKNKLSKKRTRNFEFHILWLPFLVLFFIFTILPIGSSVVLSFTDFDAVSMPKFIGLENYFRMFTSDEVLPTALKNTVLFAVFIGPYMTISAVWVIADIFNGIMALPNMIALFALSGVIVKETRDYFERKKRGEIIE